MLLRSPEFKRIGSIEKYIQGSSNQFKVGNKHVGVRPGNLYDFSAQLAMKIFQAQAESWLHSAQLVCT